MFGINQREDVWLGSSGQRQLDLTYMKQAGFAGGLFAIFVPSNASGRTRAYRHSPVMRELISSV